MKHIQSLDDFLNESNSAISAIDKSLGGYDDVEFLRIAWYKEIPELEAIIKASKEERKRKARAQGMFGQFDRRDALKLKIRIDLLNQIIKSKKKEPDYVPSYYAK